MLATPGVNPGDVHVGLRCWAPVKRPGADRLQLAEVKVIWVSSDGFVVDAETCGRRTGRPTKGSFAVCKLRRGP